MAFRIFSKPLIIGVAAGALLIGVAGYVWSEEQRPHVLEIYVFPMGSGRSIFMRTPEDIRILIDGGSNSGVIERLTRILPFYSRRIDFLVATNDAAKNVTGLIDVLNRYEVKKVYTSAITLGSLGLATSTDQVYETFLETIREKSLEIEPLQQGRRIVLGQGVVLNAIFPADPGEFAYSKASAPELLWQLKYKNTSAVFLGNASTKIQKAIASSSAIFETAPAMRSALIISQNASPENVSMQLINKIKPEYVIHSKSLSSKASSSKPPKKSKPTFNLSEYNSFNLKEGKTIKIISDGSEITILPI